MKIQNIQETKTHSIITTMDGARLHRIGGSTRIVDGQLFFVGGTPCYPDGKRWELFNDSKKGPSRTAIAG